MREYFLKTERLGFSTWNSDDIKYANSLWGDENVTKFIVANGKMSVNQIQKRLDKEIEMYLQNNIQYWPVFLLQINELVGCCGIRPYNTQDKILEFGIHLKPLYWGQGIAQEAAQAVIGYAFNSLGVNGLFAGHNPKNKDSARLLKKLGFKYTHEEFYKPTGLQHPSYLLTKEDYSSS
ncbi:GNAT family N-acetyltransferase [Priestia megaterium]|uniref:GNAT family N-acetyltransferase n=1 Tax=Priestia megaterium TaxID=1404 RepID=UPI000BF3975E|nr:GNAT family N-acetyltransferase [Priestia megaterium]PEU51092.1 GNAT family N-acetyltransferase [Priestia megaterium]